MGHRDVDEFIAALGLPSPAGSVDELEAAVAGRHGEDGWRRAQEALGAAGARARYRRLLAEPRLALDVAWGWSGGVTRGGLQALEDSNALDGLGPGDVVLDVGCGEGLVGAYVAWRTGARVVGLDLREEARGPVAHLAGRLGIRFDVALGSLLRPPRAVRALEPALVLAFRVLHEVDPPGRAGRAAGEQLARELTAPAASSRAVGSLAALAGGAPIAVLERELSPAQVLRRVRAANLAGFGAGAPDVRLIPVEGLDGRGWFPFAILRPGGATLGRAELRAVWQPAVEAPPPWHGWAAELVLAESRASFVLGGFTEDPGVADELYVDGDRVLVARYHEDLVMLHEHGRDELDRLVAELHEAAESWGTDVWQDPADRPV